jgi:hypothetical protein
LDGSGEESVSLAVRDGVIEGVKEAVGASSVLEVGTVVDVEVCAPISESIVVLVAAVLLIGVGVIWVVVQLQQMANSKVTMTILAIRPDFQKLEIFFISIELSDQELMTGSREDITLTIPTQFYQHYL